MASASLDLADYLRFVAALVLVLGLIGAGGWLLRRFGIPGMLPAAGTRSRRLGVVEVLPLDARHRLVLVQRDAVQHLILLGPADPVVIERAIPAPASEAPAPVSPSPPAAGAPAPAIDGEPAGGNNQGGRP